MSKDKKGGKRHGARPLLGRTKEQDRVLHRIAVKTRDYKNEQYRIVDGEGNILVEKRGTGHEVSATYGEKREYGRGNISIHNHPAGGTFSDEDLNEFGFGFRENVVAAPEGTYRLINKNFNKPNMYEGWMPLRDKWREIPEVSTTDLIRRAQQNLANSPTQKKIKAISNKWASIREKQGDDAAREYLQRTDKTWKELEAKNKKELAAERRRLETEPYHEFFKENAAKYGFIYRFEPR